MVVDSGCVLFSSVRAKMLAPVTVFAKKYDGEKKKKKSEQNRSFLALSTQTAHSNRCLGFFVLFFAGIFEQESQVTCIFNVDLHVITVAGSLQLPGACSPTFASCAL